MKMKTVCRYSIIIGVVLLIAVTSAVSVMAEPAAVQSQQKINPLHMVIVFTKFNGESTGITGPPDWADSIFSGEPGSIPYYFSEISHGEIVITGEYLPTVYELHNTAAYYAGETAEFVEDVLDLLDADPDVDFTHYDNDGPDGIPDTEDDDGYVDYMVLMPISRPEDLISGLADGMAGLGIRTYSTSDMSSKGKAVKLDYDSGCIASSSNLNQAVGLVCHEYLHFHTLPDLYDTKYTPGADYEEDSAGIGNWGVMGRGILGWNYQDAPVGPSAYSRVKLGFAGVGNANLIDLYGVHHGLRTGDSALPDGKIFRIWVTDTEYFLIEHRRSDNLFCERNNPANGILIWHVNDNGDNITEEHKRCDLECADGLYTDAGYPLGRIEDPASGRDNLDFWAHDSAYQDEHGGNLGDATDVFDGVTHTRFGPDTNPNSNSAETGAPTGIEIFNIRPDGDEMVFDVYAPPFTGWISTTPPIGVAYQLFAGDGDAPITHEKISVLYLVDASGDSGDDVLLTANRKSLVVDDISAFDYIGIQRLIETRIYDGGVAAINAMITRENVTADELASVAASCAVDITQLCGGEPRRVQKLTLDTAEDAVPEAFSLGQNYPNPFNGVTTIPFTLSEPGDVTVEVFNILGQRISAIDRGMLSAGTHVVSFDASAFSTGMYLYRLNCAGKSNVRTMMYVK